MDTLLAAAGHLTDATTDEILAALSNPWLLQPVQGILIRELSRRGCSEQEWALARAKAAARDMLTVRENITWEAVETADDGSKEGFHAAQLLATARNLPTHSS